MPPPDPIEEQRRAALHRERLERVLGRARQHPTMAQLPMTPAMQGVPANDYSSGSGAARFQPVALRPHNQPERNQIATAATAAAVSPEERHRERARALVGERMRERASRMKAYAGKSGGKAMAARAIQSLGIIKQSHFFYGVALLLAAIGDLGDFVTFSLPLFDFITGLLLMTLVYPYIANPGLRLGTYLVSALDFVPFVGALPFWTAATAYAWRRWAAEHREMESVLASPSAIEGPVFDMEREDDGTWAYPGAQTAVER